MKKNFTQIYGGEVIYQAGKIISRVRSGGYGFSLHKNILLAYLPMELTKAGTRIEVDLIEGRFPGQITSTVLFDPKGNHLRV